MSAMPSVSANAKNSASIVSAGTRSSFGARVVKQRQRRAVFDALADRILVEITLRGVVDAEGLERPLPVGGPIDRGSSKTEIRRVRQGRHQVVAQIAARGAMGFIDQHVDVAARIQIGGHVAELVDGRDDEAAIVAAEQLVQSGDGVRVLDVLHPQRGQVLEQLIFQFVAIDQQQDGGLVGGGRFEEQFRRLQHGEGLAAAPREACHTRPRRLVREAWCARATTCWMAAV